MERRNLVIFGLLAAGLLTVSFALFLPQSEEEQIAAQLHGLADAIGFSEPISNPVFFGSALTDRMEPFTTDHISVDLAEVRQNAPSERGKLSMFAAMALSRYGSFDVSLSDLDITLSPDGARVRALARVSATDGGGLRSDSRPVRFELTKSSGTYLVRSVLIEAPNLED